MVNNRALDQVFGALSDPTRRAIVERLSIREATVTEVASPFGCSLPAISKHLAVLEDAGLISRRAIGRQRLCSLEPGTLAQAADWLDTYRRFWTERLDALEQFLQQQEDQQ